MIALTRIAGPRSKPSPARSGMRHGPGVRMRAALRALRSPPSSGRPSSQSTPEGRPWAPLRQPRPVVASRDARAPAAGATTAIVWGDTVRLRVPTYGAFHLTGTWADARAPWQPMIPPSAPSYACASDGHP